MLMISLACRVMVCALFAGAWNCAGGVSKYPDNEQLDRRLNELAVECPSVLRLHTLAKSPSGIPVPLVELGTTRDEQRTNLPAMLAIGGIEGNDLAGSASLLAWVESLTKGYSEREAIKSLLDSRIIYVVPRLNPDAAEGWFQKPQLETAVDRQPFDDDYDGLVDEDGPEDLNRDGLITMMRIKDPNGEYILDPEEPRLLIKADPARGESGAWKLLPEGRDDDEDEGWNEDGAGGVNYNRNFPWNYQYFGKTAGIHPVSEEITRKLADFVIARPHIGIVFSFSAADNLTQAPKGEPPKRPQTAIHEGDAAIYRELGKAWREAIGLKKEVPGPSHPGTFADWMYYHRGRLALSARPWFPALELQGGEQPKEVPNEPRGSQERNDSPASDDQTKKPAPDAKGPERTAGPVEKSELKRNDEERSFLKWIDRHSPESFVSWKHFDHPEFSNQTVEIGGFAPFAKTNPPERMLDSWVNKHGKFLSELAGRLPAIGIRSAKAKHLGNRIFEVILRVENTGYLPTILAHGNVTREVLPTRVVIDVDEKDILSGRQRTMIESIEGSGGSREIRYVIHARNRNELGIRVTTALAGAAETTISLREEQ